tara:strand:- start:46 stop:840 length:795 start_codon:yes stop_codon:yes gene_type:complete
MPYLPSSARNKSEYYRKLLDADIIEQNNLIKDLELRQNVSGSIDALNPTRDDDGFVVSIEDPTNPGQAAETINESVRIENKQQFFNDRYLGQVQKPFEFFTPPSSLVEEDAQIEQEEKEIKQVETETAEPTSTSPTNQYRELLVRLLQKKRGGEIKEVSDEKLQAGMAAILKKGLKRNFLDSIKSRILANFYIKNKQYEKYIKVSIFSVRFGNFFAKALWTKLGLPTTINGTDITRLTSDEKKEVESFAFKRDKSTLRTGITGY